MKDAFVETFAAEKHHSCGSYEAEAFVWRVED